MTDNNAQSDFEETKRVVEELSPDRIEYLLNSYRDAHAFIWESMRRCDDKAKHNIAFILSFFGGFSFWFKGQDVSNLPTSLKYTLVLIIGLILISVILCTFALLITTYKGPLQTSDMLKWYKDYSKNGVPVKELEEEEYLYRLHIASKSEVFCTSKSEKKAFLIMLSQILNMIISIVVVLIVSHVLLT